MQKKVKKIGIVIACFIILFSINTISKYASAFLNNQLAFSLKKTKFKIQFNSNGGIGNMSDIENIKYSVSQTLPSNTFTKSGYDFIGWNTEFDGSGTFYSDGAEISFATTTNNDTITLYAQWFNKDYLNDTVEIYNYTCEEEVKTFVAPVTGDYVLEAWGAQGGSTSTNVSGSKTIPAIEGGRGGYSYGKIHLNAGDEIYVVVGCEGKELKDSPIDTTIAGGYNGGGLALSDGTTNYQGSGGGATHFAINQNLGVLENYDNDQNDVLVVAGGGGGSYSSLGIYYYSYGGYGGGILGGTADTYYLNSLRKNAVIKNSYIYYNGFKIPGADQTSHVNGAYYYGTFGHGTDAVKNLTGKDGGAGGGWYGGNKLSYTSGVGGMAGSGGSGHVNTTLLTEGNTIAGNVNIPTHDGTSYMIGNTGDGYARISILNNASFEGDIINLAVQDYQISPRFVQAITDYYVEVEETNITIIAESSDVNSTITGDGLVPVAWGESVKPVTIVNHNNETKEYRINVNNIRPTPPIIQIDNSDYSNDKHIVSLQNEGTALSDVDYYEYYISNSNETPADNVTISGTTNDEVEVTTSGINYIFYRTVSKKGNKSIWSNVVESKIDVNPPNVNVTAVDTYPNDVPTVTINASLTDTESGPDYSVIYYKLSTDSIYQQLTSNSFIGLAGATYDYYVVAYDNAGNNITTSVENITLKTFGQSSECGYTYSEYTSETTNNLAECTAVAETLDGLSYTTCTLGDWTLISTSVVDSCTPIAQTSTNLNYTTCTLDSDWTESSSSNVNSCTASETTTSKVTCPTNKWSSSSSQTNSCSSSGNSNSNTQYITCTENGWGNPTSSTYPTSCSSSETNTSKVTCESGYYQHNCGTSGTSYNKSSTTCGCGSSCTTKSGYWHKYTYSRSYKYTKKTYTRVSKYKQTNYYKKYTKEDYSRLYSQTIFTRTVSENVCWY